jgi:alkylation response protein AidB-like acyl-CoA dehydrogenase|tara:strand:+ start:15587 stop:16720 length:1134 start_codon:yes stop_codon:yes gene_type:complete
MALILNEEQTMLKESVKDFLNMKSPISALRALRDTDNPEGFDRAVWKDMAELGLSGLTISEEFGGLDFGYMGLGQALEETGRTLAASPLVSTVLLSTTAINLCGTVAQKEALLPELAMGNLVMSFAHEEKAQHNPNYVATSAILKDNNYILNGSKTFVLDGHVADKFIVVARTSGNSEAKEGIQLFLVDSNADGVEINRTVMLDSRNSAKINFSNVVIPKENKMDLAYFESLEKIYAIGAIGLAAEMLGSAQECFERTLAYLKERQQFGVAIGSFQALQHRAAKMFIDIELSKSVVIKGLKAIDTNEENLTELASVAKAKLGQTLKLVSNEGIQMHGGVGMTDEVEIGFFVKRARVAQQTLGDYNYHLNRYAKLKGY